MRYGTEGVLDIAHDFYTDLYTSQGTDAQIQDRILDALDASLSEGSRDMCDARVTIEELAESLRGLQNGKSPGSDGFPAEFWKFFWSDIAADFKMVVDWVYDSGRLTGMMAGGIIRLLFKKGDRLDVRNLGLNRTTGWPDVRPIVRPFWTSGKTRRTCLKSPAKRVISSHFPGYITSHFTVSSYRIIKLKT